MGVEREALRTQSIWTSQPGCRLGCSGPFPRASQFRGLSGAGYGQDADDRCDIAKCLIVMSLPSPVRWPVARRALLYFEWLLPEKRPPPERKQIGRLAGGQPAFTAAWNLA